MIKNKKDFVKKSNEIHSNKYDYSLVDYVKSNNKVIITCPIHGNFLQSPAKHLLKRGCPECGRLRKGKKMNSFDFIKKAKRIHDDKYDYSLVNYINNKHKIKIICNKHGIFNQSPRDHLNGAGCSCCGKIKNINSIKLKLQDFIARSNKIHNNKYDYSLVDYKNNSINVIITCPIHGNFKQRPSHHLNGSGCSCCGNVKKGKKNNVLDFIKNAEKVHSDKYDYSLVNYNNSKTKVIIICPIHGNFKQRPNDHLSGAGCPKCNQSKGESIIESFLIDNNIKYENQKRFKDCKDKQLLPFDFYLPEFNTCIEYDGEHHFKPVCFGGISKERAIVELKKTKERDIIKNNFCKDNSIDLIRICYFDDIMKRLNFIIKEV